MKALVSAVLTAVCLCTTSVEGAGESGLFESDGDVGRPGKPGALEFDASSNAYVVAGGGENMWFTNDAFHFVWRQVTGDFSLEAAIEWLTAGGNAHRKACLIVRQNLAADSPYVDVAVHGDGLTSLQFRETPGGPTREVQAIQKRPARVGLERQGEAFVLFAPADGDGPLQPAGPTIRVRLTDPLYVGLAVCAHDDKALEKARFSSVKFTVGKPNADHKAQLHSTLETVAISSKDRRAVYHTTNLIEAPNWSPDGSNLVFNSRGRLFRLSPGGGTPEPIDTGFANRCNNDHGISPDGLRLVISDQSRGGKSLIYTLPFSGGTPQAVTPTGPSYWHSWSPDALTLAFCAERSGEFDIYTIPVAGGEEKRLTSAKGLDDGPDYSPDGRFIYFNSERSGSMQIWRMKPDGTDQEQVTSEEFNNWFPHPSPDGRWLVFLSYENGVTGHPANEPVRLRLLPLAGGPVQELARLFGGQGTINVPSWSPDSRNVSFVSYELITPR